MDEHALTIVDQQQIQPYENPEVNIEINYISTIADLMSCDGLTVALDTETNGLNPWQNHIIGLGFYCQANGTIGYIPTLDDKDRIDIIDAANHLSSNTKIIMHNAKFDLHFMKMDPKIGGWTILDTTVMIHLLDSRYRKNLKDAETRFLGSDSKRAHVDSAPARVKIWDWPLRLTSAYCANDARVTYQLAEKLYPTIVDLKLDSLFWKDMNYLRTLYSVEEHGVSLDVDFVDWGENKLKEHIEIMEENLWDSCGHEFNWRSPQQLSNAIYGGLGIPKPKNPFADADGVDRSRFADAGKYKSTCTATFILTEKIHHPLGELISALREADKLRRNYLKWLDQIDEDEILHSTFNITGTRTGRLSSSKPNLQNVASNVRGRFTQSVYTGSVKRTDEYNMRKAIIPRKGNLFLSIDYKQMEMRMFGVLSRDPFMLENLLAGKDVHLEIALKVWGDCGYDMNQVHREWSKTISFGLIYGMTIGSLMYKLNMNRMQASRVTDQYWAQFPRIKPWMSEVIESCKNSGYLRYWSGRMWREDNPIDCYKGCNALIQGGCADLLSIAAIRVDEWIGNNSPGSSMVSLVHDEIITEIPWDKIIYNSKHISDIMHVPDLVGIPFATDVKVGPSYGEMFKIPKEYFLKDEEVSLQTFIHDESLAIKEPEPEDNVIDAEFEDIEDDEE